MYFLRFSLLSVILAAFATTAYSSSEPEYPTFLLYGVETTPSNELEVKILKSVTRLIDIKKKTNALEAKMQGLSGDALASYRLQQQEEYRVIIREARELATLLQNYSRESGSINAAVDTIVSRFETAEPRLIRAARHYIETLTRNNRSRDIQTFSGLNGYIQDSFQVDMGLSLLDEYISITEQLNASSKLATTYLNETLPKRADELVAHMRLSQQRIDDYKNRLEIDQTNVELKQKLALMQDSLNADIRSLVRTLKMAEVTDMDTSYYQAVLVKTTGEISPEMFSGNVIELLMRDWWLEWKQSLHMNGINIAIKALIFIFTLAIFKILSHFISGVIVKAFGSNKLGGSVLMQEMITRTISRLVMLFGVLFALAQLGVSIGPLLAGLGVAGFIIGFALQDTLGNFAAGVMILFYRPYDVGDVVEAGGAFGKVKSMNLVSTTVLTFDNQTLIIPNKKIWGDTIKNVTGQKVRRVDMEFSISYHDSIDLAEEIILSLLTAHPNILPSPEPLVKVNRLGNHSVDFIVRPWVKRDDYWEVYWDITRSVKEKFDENGITIPFPQSDVHIRTPLELPGKTALNKQQKSEPETA